MLCRVTHCAGCVSANTRPHQLCWGDGEMGTAISCTECSQVAGLIQKIGRSSSKASSLNVSMQVTNAAIYQCSKLPTQQVTNAASYQRSKLPMQQFTNAASY